VVRVDAGGGWLRLGGLGWRRFAILCDFARTRAVALARGRVGRSSRVVVVGRGGGGFIGMRPAGVAGQLEPW